MLFNTAQYAIFLAVVLLLVHRGSLGWRNGVLLVASLLFYSLWTPAYIFLLLADIIVNYVLLRAVARSAHPRLPLVASIVFTVGLLGWFKYAAFAVETALPLLRLVGHEPVVPEVFLPLGISFFSFQIIALAVDTYRGRDSDAEVPSLPRYALFVSFFPQLIAGPILRGHQLLPQLARRPRPTREQVRRGFWLLASGLAKKTILADFLLAPFVDQVFASPGIGNAAFHWVAMFGFSVQVYYDFSGYSDMARGSALLLGYELPLNFAEPYLSRNPQELWRRWHITLSGWLRDYPYIGMGGNRTGAARTYVNLFLTMLIAGLWHGAAWTYVIWGAMHGVLLAVDRLLRRGRRSADPPLRLRDAPAIAFMFTFWSFACLFFRSTGMQETVDFIQALVSPSHLHGFPVLQTGLVIFCLFLHLAERWLRLRLPVIHSTLASRAWGLPLEALLFGGVIGLAIACSGTGAAFVYFQF
jgi:D-alanyl-lipoteichoic acid acyltransferase DltB (MBOAT superfamily)